jgi:hypothetical protein
MRLPEALAAVACFCVVGCAGARPVSPPAVTPAAAAPVAIHAPTGRVVALAVHDPTDLEARLATFLRASLQARGITVTPARTGALQVEVFVLNRQRSEQQVQLHEQGTRTASGIGFASGVDDPARLPELHTAGLESFDAGRTYRQSDLRMIVSASLRQVGVPRTLARWDTEQGTLLRVGDGAESPVNPWLAVYGAVAEQLADQVAAVLGER